MSRNHPLPGNLPADVLDPCGGGWLYFFEFECLGRVGLAVFVDSDYSVFRVLW